MKHFVLLLFFLCHFFQMVLESAPIARTRLRDILALEKEQVVATKYLLLRQPDFYGFIPGMFSVFNGVIGCLDLYEKEGYGGIGVHFGNEGLYFDPKRGGNWWSYYCEPIEMGSKEKLKLKIFRNVEYMERMHHAEFNLSRERVHELISKYISFKPNVMEAVDQFESEHFKEKFVIGIHYRGTDKSSEAPRVPYRKVKEAIDLYAKTTGLEDFTIFVATDEEKFLFWINEAFPSKVVFLSAERSHDGRPLHYFSQDTYQQGLDSLRDCHLLSRCDLLIKTSSNLSLWSMFLNPKIPVILLNDRFPPP